MKVKLNIKSIIAAERLLGKPFGELDLSNEEVWLTILYCMVAENNDQPFTLSAFKRLQTQKKVWSDIVGSARAEFDYVAQFSKEGKSDGETPRITDLAVLLITSGVDAEFVYDMRTHEMADFVKAIDERRREQMESDRFWTYLTILPHIDGKKLKSPSALVMFPWEKKENEETTERAIETFKKFVGWQTED